VTHAVWVNLKAPDLRQRFDEGTYSPDLSDFHAAEARNTADLVSRLMRSFVSMLVVSAVALVIGFVLGSLGPSLPLNLRKALAFVSTFLVAWATLFELGTGIVSWSGETLNERLHPRIFQLLFIPGTLGLLCSIIL
jgi:hypothetical protein